MSSIRNTTVIIKRTGELMLSGWKMLAITCPICNTALLSKLTQTRCPCCDLPVLNEGDPRIKSSASGVVSVEQSAQPAIIPSYESGSKDNEEVPASLEELKKEYDLQNKKKNAVSSKLGEKMLSGWTLLAACCPSGDCGGTPLMSFKGGNMLCVGCNTEYTTSEYGELVAVAASQPKTTTVVSASPAVQVKPVEEKNTTSSHLPPVPPSQQSLPTLDELDAEYDDLDSDMEGFNFDDMPILSMSSFATDKNDASYKISQSLLKGWALLDQVCPSAICNGSCPLMRDREGVRRCVDCLYAVDLNGVVIDGPKIGSVDAAVIANTATNAATTSHTAKSELTSRHSRHSVEVESNEEDSGDEVEEFFQNWREKLNAEKNGASAVAASYVPENTHVKIKASPKLNLTVGKGTKNKTVDVTSQRSQVCSRVLNVLHNKLLQSADSLEGSDSVDKSLKLAELIIKLSAAVKEVDGICGEGEVYETEEETYF